MPLSPRTLRPSSSFTPKSISGLALWLDASATGDLYQNSDGTVPAVNAGDPVGYWRDRSGNNRHATQGTAGNRPTISADKQGGRTAVAFASSTRAVTSPATVAQYVADATTSPKMFFAWVARPEGGVAGVTFGTAPTNPNSSSRVFFSSDYGSYGSHIVDFGSIAGARLSGTVGDEANNVGHVYSAYRDGSVVAVRRDGVEILRKTNASGSYTATNGTLSLNIAEAGGSTSSWMEFMAYAASMPSANIARLERYLASKWGITLAPQVYNADAQDWINRVYANGGTVSSSTASAVDTFCNAIDAAGLRDRFYRLNLFAGTGLNAALIPLYRGPSLGGTQYGNTTDTNVGPFVSGDYAETGASCGLQGNGTSKYLNTGVNALTSPPTNTNQHLAAYCTAQVGAGSKFIIAANNSSSGGPGLGRLNTGSIERFCTPGVTVDGSSSLLSGFLAGNANATNVSYYRNGVALATASTPASLANNNDNIYVFAGNGGGTASLFSDRRLCAYSYGMGMTDAQWSAYNTAMQAFQTALGRNI